MVIKTREREREIAYLNLQWIPRQADSSAEFYENVSSLEMEPRIVNLNLISSDIRHMRWPQLINSLNAIRGREREGESEREAYIRCVCVCVCMGADLTVPKDMPMKFNTFSWFFF